MQIERDIPANRTRGRLEKYAALREWADRTDPGGKIRYDEIRKAWDTREPGQDIVIVAY